MNYYFKKGLKTELPKWRDSGIITDETAQKIASMYDLDDKSAISFVGYLFFGLSLLILVGANWQEIPRFGRFIIVLFLTGMDAFCRDLYSQKRRKTQRLSLFSRQYLLCCLHRANLADVSFWTIYRRWDFAFLRCDYSASFNDKKRDFVRPATNWRDDLVCF